MSKEGLFAIGPVDFARSGMGGFGRMWGLVSSSMLPQFHDLINHKKTYFGERR
jgi:hypothetical protein